MLNYFFPGLVLFVYGTAFMVSLVFTLSIETYKKISDRLNFVVFRTESIGVLDLKIFGIDYYLMQNNKIVGAILSLLSFLDIKLLLGLVRNF